MKENEKPTFTYELTQLINKHSIDVAINAPDFIIADMLVSMLRAIRIAQVKTIDWRTPKPGSPETTYERLAAEDPSGLYG